MAQARQRAAEAAEALDGARLRLREQQQQQLEAAGEETEALPGIPVAVKVPCPRLSSAQLSRSLLITGDPFPSECEEYRSKWQRDGAIDSGAGAALKAFLAMRALFRRFASIICASSLAGLERRADPGRGRQGGGERQVAAGDRPVRPGQRVPALPGAFQGISFGATTSTSQTLGASAVWTYITS